MSWGICACSRPALTPQRGASSMLEPTCQRSSTSGEDAWQSVSFNELMMKLLAVSHRLSCPSRCLPACPGQCRSSPGPAPLCCQCGCWGSCRSSPENGCFQTWACAQFDKPSFICTSHQTISHDITWFFESPLPGHFACDYRFPRRRLSSPQGLLLIVVHWWLLNLKNWLVEGKRRCRRDANPREPNASTSTLVLQTLSP